MLSNDGDQWLSDEYLLKEQKEVLGSDYVGAENSYKWRRQQSEIEMLHVSPIL